MVAIATSRLQSSQLWALAAAQDDVLRRDQLLDRGLTVSAIKHRIRVGRLFPLWPGVYAVGTPQVTRKALFRAAVYACGPDAALSHDSAAALLDIRPDDTSEIHVSIPEHRRRKLPGIRAHRRANLQPPEVIDHDGIPLTCVATTLVDIACELSPAELERAINEADKLDLIDPETLRRELDRMPRRPGRAKARRLLDRRTFVLTDSELERRFVPIARRAGLGKPITGARVNGFRVDFYWPELGLVVETDGLRYHRTPAQQNRDRLRDQVHAAAGLAALRFTHSQIYFEPRRVEAVLRSVHVRLSGQ